MVVSPDIVLVLPPNQVLSDPTSHTPLGPGYLEAVLVKAGYNVGITDLRDKRLETSLIPRAPVIGISATTGEIDMAKQIARELKERDPKVLTVIGGPHATYLPSGCLDFDIVVIGEAESVIAEIASGKRTNSGLVFASATLNLDSLPFPTRHPWSFSTTLLEGGGYGTGPLATGILTSRGCPMKCCYCREEAGLVRFRSPENVVDEVKQIQEKWNCHNFRFEDDNLTLNKKRALRLFELLEPLNIHWRAHTRANLWDNELAESAKRAGCREIGFGFEAATDYILQLIRKDETVDQYREAVRVTKRHGITCKAFWVASLPGETWLTIADIQKFMLEEKPDKWIVSRLCPYPGSDIWKRPEQYGIKWLDRNFSHYWNFWDEAMVEYEDVSKHELNEHYQHLFAWLSKEFPR